MPCSQSQWQPSGEPQGHPAPWGAPTATSLGHGLVLDSPGQSSAPLPPTSPSPPCGPPHPQGPSSTWAHLTRLIWGHLHRPPSRPAPSRGSALTGTAAGTPQTPLPEPRGCSPPHDTVPISPVTICRTRCPLSRTPSSSASRARISSQRAWEGGSCGSGCSPRPSPPRAQIRGSLCALSRRVRARSDLGLLVGFLHAADAAVGTPELGQLPLCGTEPLLEGVHGFLEALCCRQDPLQAAVPAPGRWVSWAELPP